MAKKKKSSLLADVARAIVVKRPGKPRWDDLLTPKLAEEFNTVRDNWASGSLPGTLLSVAKAVIKVAKERGIPISGEQGVRRWLRKA